MGRGLVGSGLGFSATSGAGFLGDGLVGLRADERGLWR